MNVFGLSLQKQIKIKDLVWHCCLRGDPQVEGDEGTKGVDWRQENVGAWLLPAESLVQPQAQSVQQLCQDRCLRCDVMPLGVHLQLVPVIWCHDFDIKEGHRNRVQRLGRLGLQGLAADISDSKEGEGVDVDTVGLTS